MVIPCALCQTAAASVFCVNDDAHLCTGCDASVHAGNPLLARHERRPIACTAGECASAAHGSPVSTECCDVAVVPQFVSASVAAHAEPESALMQPAAPAAAASFAPYQQQYAPYQQQFEQYGQQQAAALAPVAAEPLALYEDAFFSRNLTTNDLLDFDSDDLVLPGISGAGSFACFDPLDDCVVPSFGASATFHAPADRYMPAAAPAHLHAQQSFMQQPNSYMSPYMQQQQPNHLVPMGGMSAAAAAPRPAAVQQQIDPEAEAARVQRHRERQRKKRAFGRAVRYQSRRAYAEIRPRIKGRFVTPEEYAVYQAQQAAAAKAGLPVDDPEQDDMAYDDAAYEVPVGKGAYEAAYAPAPAVAPAVSEEDAAVPVYVA